MVKVEVATSTETAGTVSVAPTLKVATAAKLAVVEVVTTTPVVKVEPTTSETVAKVVAGAKPVTTLPGLLFTAPSLPVSPTSRLLLGRSGQVAMTYVGSRAEEVTYMPHQPTRERPSHPVRIR